jgi:hypothetical protein
MSTGNFLNETDTAPTNGRYRDDHWGYIVLFQDSAALWPSINEVPIWKMLVMVIGFTLCSFNFGYSVGRCIL